jgi:hypothetical protein
MLVGCPSVATIEAFRLLGLSRGVRSGMFASDHFGIEATIHIQIAEAPGGRRRDCVRTMTLSERWPAAPTRRSSDPSRKPQAGRASVAAAARTWQDEAASRASSHKRKAQEQEGERRGGNDNELANEAEWLAYHLGKQQRARVLVFSLRPLPRLPRLLRPFPRQPQQPALPLMQPMRRWSRCGSLVLRRRGGRLKGNRGVHIK